MQQTRTVRPVLGVSSSNNSERNIDDKWFSPVWKSGEMSNTSTGRPVDDKFVIDDDMDLDTAAESNSDLKSRSFRVNDRLRKMMNRSPDDPMQDIDKRQERISQTIGCEQDTSDNFWAVTFSSGLGSFRRSF